MEKAVRVLQELDPVGVDSTVAVANLFLKLDHGKDALPLVERALRLHPQDARLLTFRTAAHTYGGDFPALAASAIDTLEATPTDEVSRRMAMYAFAWAGCAAEASAIAPDVFYRTIAWSMLSNGTTPPPSLPETGASLHLRAVYSSYVPTEPQVRRAAWEAVHSESPYTTMTFLGTRGYLPYLLWARRDVGDVEGARALEREIKDFHRRMETEGWAGFERDMQKFYLAAALGERRDLYRIWDAFFDSGAWYAVAPYRPIMDPFRSDREFRERVSRYETESATAKTLLERNGVLARVRKVIAEQGWTADTRPL
jgi:hypothetical protein